MRSVRISTKTARALLTAAEHYDTSFGGMSEIIRHLEHALEVKPRQRAARKVREANRADHAAETSEVYEAVMQRAGLYCEACRQPFQRLDPLELDHFFGRVRAKQSPETTWAIHRSCHRDKTANRPNAAHWIRLFVAHCQKHGFLGSLRMASGRLDAITLTRGAP